MSNLEQRIADALSLHTNRINELSLIAVLRDVLAEVAKGECQRDNVLKTSNPEIIRQAIKDLEKPCTCIVCIANQQREGR